MKIFLRSTNVKLLRQIKGNSINRCDFIKCVFSVKSGSGHHNNRAAWRKSAVSFTLRNAQNLDYVLTYLTEQYSHLYLQIPELPSNPDELPVTLTASHSNSEYNCTTNNNANRTTDHLPRRPPLRNSSRVSWLSQSQPCSRRGPSKYRSMGPSSTCCVAECNACGPLPCTLATGKDNDAMCTVNSDACKIEL